MYKYVKARRGVAAPPDPTIIWVRIHQPGATHAAFPEWTESHYDAFCGIGSTIMAFQSNCHDKLFGCVLLSQEGYLL